jgi:restriction system protein
MPRKKKEGAQFTRYFGPLLDALRALGGSGTPDEVVERIAKDCGITDEVQNELMSSGELRFRNQVHWARFYLASEGLLDSSKRGVWSLTERGRATTLSPEQAREMFLKLVHIYQEQRRAKTTITEAAAEQMSGSIDDKTTGAILSNYRAEVIELILKLPASGFERLSQRILREAGFTQVVVTGSSGDGGIDGYGTL